VRSPHNIIFREQFHELAQQNPNFYFYVTCTRIDDGSIGEEAEWKGRRGRISPVWVMEHVHDLKNTIFYACGPNELVEFAEEIVLRGLNLPKEQMKTEKWG
jgi:ferredoxin-NADP reductase